MPDGGRGFPLNASFRFSGDSVTFVLQDLMSASDATVDGRTVPLEADFSAAVAFTYYERTKTVSKIAALLRPGEYDDMIGMYSFEPFKEDRIPLILVHGLMSTAEGWLPFVNLLLADPVVREKYQIFLFNYPTGNPIAANAADLRASLEKFTKDNDPKHRNPKMRKMVILGESTRKNHQLPRSQGGFGGFFLSAFQLSAFQLYPKPLFPRPPVRPNGCFRDLPPKANS